MNASGKKISLVPLTKRWDPNEAAPLINIAPSPVSKKTPAASGVHGSRFIVGPRAKREGGRWKKKSVGYSKSVWITQGPGLKNAAGAVTNAMERWRLARMPGVRTQANHAAVSLGPPGLAKRFCGRGGGACPAAAVGVRASSTSSYAPAWSGCKHHTDDVQTADGLSPAQRYRLHMAMHSL